MDKFCHLSPRPHDSATSSSPLRKGIHTCPAGQGRRLGFMLTGGKAFDYKAVDDFIALPVTRTKLMLADKGYDNDNVRTSLLVKATMLGIPARANRKQVIDCNFRAYRDHNSVERILNGLKKFQRIVTQSDKTPSLSQPCSLSLPQNFGCQIMSKGPGCAVRVTGANLIEGAGKELTPA